ncbi:MAG: hypothetical protein KZQ96_22445 [Candidatus Thiodiazotropha sp. (ex Lucinoma borealis)]|nr:hypothetical protein [Candidatus Thiodiazotropha sp. (ex Lucinoma borealis)]
MAKIYIASKDVFEVGEHSYWVFDPDDDPNNLNERIIRGGDTNVDTFSPYLMEIDRLITNSRDTLHEYDSNDNIITTLDPYADRNYTTVINGTLSEVQSVWDTMVAEAKTFGTSTIDPWVSSEGGFISVGTDAYVLPENSYQFFTTNCNCFTNTVGFAVDIDFANHIPLVGGDLGNGDTMPIIQYTGLDNVFLSTLDDVILITPRNTASYDQGGNDTYIYDVVNTDTFQNIDIYEDTNTVTSDRIVLTNVNVEDIRFGYNSRGDFEIFFEGNPFNSPAITVNSQFSNNDSKIEKIYVYQNNGEGLVVLDVTNAADFMFLPSSTQEGDPTTEPEAVTGWVAGSLEANGSSEHLNDLVKELEEAIQVITVEGQISSTQSYPVTFTDENGNVTEISLNPAERRVLNFEADVADVEANGLVISQASEVITNPDGSVVNQTTTVIEDAQGNRYNVVEVELADGSIIPANGFQSTKFVERTTPDGLTVTGTQQETTFIRNGQKFETTEFQKDPDANWSIQQKVTNPDGTISDDGPLFVVPSAGLLEALQFGGSTLGGLLGNHLADDNVYKQVVYSAVLKTIGSHFGTFTAFLAVGGELEAAVRAGMGEQIVGAQTAVITPEFMDTLYANLSGAVAGALSNVIVDEVGEALGIDGTVVGEVFDVTATTVTTGIISGGIDVLFNGIEGSVYANLLAGDGVNFSTSLKDINTELSIPGIENPTVGDYVQYQIANAVGAYVGGRLAGEVIEAESEVAALFGAAGSAFATAIATGSAFSSLGVAQAFASLGWAGGPIGAAIGAFVGTVVGTAFGNLFGGDDDLPQAWARVSYDPNTQQYSVGSNWESDGGDASSAFSMAQ